MNEFSEALQVRPGLTAIIGGGGKTTLLYRLARELEERGSVIVTTSTHIFKPTDLPFALTAGKVSGILCVGMPCENGKLSAPQQSFRELTALADYVLVEADGSAGRPLKAHAPHEPVIPACAVQTVCVVGADGFDRPIAEVCHRPERYAAICGAALTDIVTPAMAAQVLLAEGYGGGWVYVNKVETPRDRANAAALAAALPGTVVAGSLHRREYQVY